jgi:hypothetical protein
MGFDNMDYDYEDGDDVFNQPLEFDPHEQEPAQDGGGGFQVGDLFSRITGDPKILGVTALVIGLVIGLLIAWVLWPVQVTGITPGHLDENYKLDYARMVVDSFNRNEDSGLANWRFQGLGSYTATALDTLKTDQDFAADMGAFLSKYNVNAPAVAPDGSVMPQDDTAPSDDPAAPDEGQEGGGNSLIGGSRTSSLLLAACAVTGVVAVGLAAFYFLRMRNRSEGPQTAAARANEINRQAVQTDYTRTEGGTPIAQWMTTYLVGDDLFDDSFSIDSPSGEFLGECGVGIADTIGVGEPKRVSAFEVWLFDKNDIQTVTKVLMSAHAMNDESTYARLEAKGEPVMAAHGGTVALDTKTLKMTVRVMDMDYGTGHLPENSFFQRITLELAVWSLDEEDEGELPPPLDYDPGF